MESYEDILYLEHHVSKKHPQMSIYNRAAQFAPFAALSGHGEAIAETARLTEGKIELDDYEKLKLDEKVYILQERIAEVPEVCITYFRPDTKKNGGEMCIRDRYYANDKRNGKSIIFFNVWEKVCFC